MHWTILTGLIHLRGSVFLDVGYMVVAAAVFVSQRHLKFKADTRQLNMALAEKALRGAFYPIFLGIIDFLPRKIWKAFGMLWYSNRTEQYQHIPRRQGKGRAPLSHQTNHDHHGSPGSNMKVSEAELKQLEANVRQLELHVMQEIELQSAESISRDAHVQHLMRELGRLANAGTGDERVEEREKQLQQIKRAKEILDHAFGVTTTIHEVPNEIDEV